MAVQDNSSTNFILTTDYFINSSTAHRRVKDDSFLSIFGSCAANIFLSQTKYSCDK